MADVYRRYMNPHRGPWRFAGAQLYFEFSAPLCFSRPQIEMDLATRRRFLAFIREDNIYEAANMMAYMSVEQRRQLVSTPIGHTIPLFEACAIGSWRVLHYFLAECQAPVNQMVVIILKLRDTPITGNELRFFGTVVHIAVLMDDEVMLRFLVDHGGSVNALTYEDQHHDEFVMQPLHIACLLNHLGMVTMLVHLGADVNARGAMGNSSLWYGIENREVLDFLLSQGADVNHCNDDGQTILHQPSFVVSDKLLRVLVSLLPRGAHPDIKDCWGHTAFSRPLSLSPLRMPQLSSPASNTLEELDVIELYAAEAIHLNMTELAMGLLQRAIAVRQMDPNHLGAKHEPDASISSVFGVHEIFVGAQLQELNNREYAGRQRILMMERILGKCPEVMFCLLNEVEELGLTRAEMLGVFTYVMAFLKTALPLTAFSCWKAIMPLFNSAVTEPDAVESHLIPFLLLCMTSLGMALTKEEKAAVHYGMGALRHLSWSTNFLRSFLSAMDVLLRNKSFAAADLLPEVRSKVEDLLLEHPRIFGMEEMGSNLDVLDYLLHVSSTIHPARQGERGAPHLHRDEEGNTWLHLQLLHARHLLLDYQRLADLFLRSGIHRCARNSRRQSVTLLLAMRGLPSQSDQPLSLCCLAATVAAQHLPRQLAEQIVPKPLLAIISNH